MAVADETMSLVEAMRRWPVVAARHLQLYTSDLPKPVLCSVNQCATDSVSLESLVNDHASYATEIARCVKERKCVEANTPDDLFSRGCHNDFVHRTREQRFNLLEDKRWSCLVAELLQQRRDCGVVRRSRFADENFR